VTARDQPVTNLRGRRAFQGHGNRGGTGINLVIIGTGGTVIRPGAAHARPVAATGDRHDDRLARRRRPRRLARLRHWQHACATYTVAPGTLVAASSSPGRRFIAPIPACWTNYTAVAGVPFVSMPGNMPTTVVFMHEMRTPDGRPRIVVVYCNPIYLPSASVVQSLGPVSIDPAKGWSLTSRPAFRGGHVPGGYPAGDNVQLFAGQPDPSDPTRFTMAFIRKGRAGTVDGRLDDDDVVTFQVRW